MFADSKLQSIIWTSRIEEAERFYSDTLGLALSGRSDGALVYDVGGSVLRVGPVPSTEPGVHTVMGFAVADVKAAVAYLAGHGVAVERFAGMPHDDDGILVSPDGARVAWFRDPDGNILSVVQFPGPGY